MRLAFLVAVCLAGCGGESAEVADALPVTATVDATAVADIVTASDVAGPDAPGVPEATLADLPMADLPPADLPPADLPPADLPPADLPIDGLADAPVDPVDAMVDAPDAGEPCGASDAGDLAWARRAVQVLLGRNPLGMRELDALVALIAATDRETVARGLMRAPEYVRRWSLFLVDEMQINRSHLGSKSIPDCFERRLLADDDVALTEWLKTADALGAPYAAPFTLADVTRSALLADDLRGFFRGMVFGMMTQPGQACANTTLDEIEASRRVEFGTRFVSVYLNRTLECMACHNAEWSTTDRPDPVDDRYWTLPGRLEKGVFGTSYGRPAEDIFGALRFQGVASKAMLTDEGEADRFPEDPTLAVTPWGMDPACGAFMAPDAIAVDPLAWGGWLVDPEGGALSVWDLERSLAQGFASLAEGGLGWSDQAEIDGPRAFAYLLAARIADRLWNEVFGAPLTLGHGSSRNPDQQDRLVSLTETLITSGWSLRAALVAVVMDPYFNPPSPSAQCPEAADYGLAPLFDPYSVERAPPEDLNGPGDIVHRVSGRVLTGMYFAALGLEPMPSYPRSGGEEGFLRAAGAFVTDTEPGFSAIDFQGAIRWEEQVAYCWPPDFHGNNADWLIELGVAALAPADPAYTFRDLAVALKDRLLNEPDIAAEEVPLIAAVMTVPDLDHPVADYPPEFWRTWIWRFCGVLATSPQFVLQGLAHPPQTTRPRLQTPGPDWCEVWAERVLGEAALPFDCAAE